MPHVFTKDDIEYVSYDDGMVGLQKKVALLWNECMTSENRKTRKVTLSKVVAQLVADGFTKMKVLQAWDYLHAAIGYGKKVPDGRLYGRKPVLKSECSDDWLGHHGLARNN